MTFLSYRLRAMAATCGLLLAACSPTFNWRDTPIADTGLLALMPCKPDRASRALPLGTESVTVDMVGCEAGGATFAIAHAGARDVPQAEAWQRAWRAATRAQAGEVDVVESPGALPRAAAAPAPVRLEAGGAMPMQVLWFARQQPGGAVTLYQATVLGRPSSPDAVTTFFESLRLPR
ncbi:hypothetical protein [Variovorax sp. PAMC 28711]|uniref:hypothetical protein n=1 Tax=Variovorax sp. PAMC 28711 TaxID=1795631 RepID=UPI00078E5430|nr:hypothetical protein [Variovorax sp. PAMC 28711]AMM24455.1 hypothetical protein AX767_08900 [Variovorax sp. PAMC 28711]